MLKINIIAVGKNKEKWIDESVQHYSRLLSKYTSLSFIYIPDVKKSKKTAASESVRKETRLIQARLGSGYQIALSDKGRLLDSLQFANLISELMHLSGGTVDFIIGGPCGLDKSLMKTCHDVISLSPMTVSHQLIRPVLMEQLFRAFSIITGGKYHK